MKSKTKRTGRKGKDHCETTSTANPNIEIDEQGRQREAIGGESKIEEEPRTLAELAERIRICNTFMFKVLLPRDYDDEDFRCAEKEYAKFYCMAANLGGGNIPPLKTANPVYDLKRLEQWCKGDLEARNGKEKLQAKPKKRATQDEMKTRNTVVLHEAIKLKDQYDRLPTVDEIEKVTKYTPRQIRETVAYRKGKIAKTSSRLTTETARSAKNSEYADSKASAGQQNIKRSKIQQLELEELIDNQKRDDSSNHA